MSRPLHMEIAEAVRVGLASVAGAPSPAQAPAGAPSIDAQVAEAMAARKAFVAAAEAAGKHFEPQQLAAWLEEAGKGTP